MRIGVLKKIDDISLLCGVSDTLVFKKVQYGGLQNKEDDFDKMESWSSIRTGILSEKIRIYSLCDFYF